MEWKRIQTELRRLESLVDGWAAANRISTLERDLALDKLKALYEELRFADAVVADGSDEVSDAAAFAPELSIRIDLEEAIAPFGGAEELSPTAPGKETVGADPPQEAAGPGVAASEPEKPLSEQLVREGLVPQPDATAEAVRMEEARPDAQNAQTVPSEPGERGEKAGRSVEAAVLSAGTSAPCAADAEQPATEGSRPEATAPERREPVLNSLFDLDDLVDRRRKNRRVILSLYESEEEDVRPAAPVRHKEKHGTDRSERRDMRRAADSSTAGPDTEKSVSPQPFAPVGEGAASAVDAGMSAAGKVEGTSETRPESAPETMPHAGSEQIRPEIGLDDDAKCGAESPIPTALEPSSPNGNAGRRLSERGARGALSSPMKLRRMQGRLSGCIPCLSDPSQRVLCCAGVRNPDSRERCIQNRCSGRCFGNRFRGRKFRNFPETPKFRRPKFPRRTHQRPKFLPCTNLRDPQSGPVSRSSGAGGVRRARSRFWRT